MGDSLQIPDSDDHLKSVLKILKTLGFLESVTHHSLNLSSCNSVKNTCIVRLIHEIVSQEIFDESKIFKVSQAIQIFVSRIINNKSVQKRIDHVFLVILIHFHCHSVSKNCSHAIEALNIQCTRFCLMHKHFYLEIERPVYCSCNKILENYSNSPFFCETLKKSKIVNFEDISQCQKFASFPLLEYSKPFLYNIIENATKRLNFCLIDNNSSSVSICGNENCKKIENKSFGSIKVLNDIYFIELLNENFGCSITENFLLLFSIPFSIELNKIYFPENAPQVYLQGIVFTKGTTCKFIQSEVVANNIISLIKKMIFNGFSVESLVYSKKETVLNYNEEDLPDIYKLLRLACQIDWFNSNKNSNFTSVVKCDWKVLKDIEINEKKQWICNCNFYHDYEESFCTTCYQVREGLQGYFCKRCIEFTFDEKYCKKCSSSFFFNPSPQSSKSLGEIKEYKVNCMNCNENYNKSSEHKCKMTLRKTCQTCQKKINDTETFCIGCREKNSESENKMINESTQKNNYVNCGYCKDYMSIDHKCFAHKNELVKELDCPDCKSYRGKSESCLICKKSFANEVEQGPKPQTRHETTRVISKNACVVCKTSVGDFFCQICKSKLNSLTQTCCFSTNCKVVFKENIICLGCKINGK